MLRDGCCFIARGRLGRVFCTQCSPYHSSKCSTSHVCRCSMLHANRTISRLKPLYDLLFHIRAHIGDALEHFGVFFQHIDQGICQLLEHRRQWGASRNLRLAWLWWDIGAQRTPNSSALLENPRIPAELANPFAVLGIDVITVKPSDPLFR